MGDSMILVSSQGEIANTISWSGRNISVTVHMQDKNSQRYVVSYIGKHYWIEKYHWNISGIQLIG